MTVILTVSICVFLKHHVYVVKVLCVYLIIKHISGLQSNSK